MSIIRKDYYVWETFNKTIIKKLYVNYMKGLLSVGNIQ
jgi:hypothetical protein